MPHAHLKAVLRCIDQLHTSAKMRAMALAALQDQINPGVNHLVAEGALRGLLRQRLEHGSGEHDFATPSSCHCRAPSVEARRPGHAAITPSHGRQRFALHSERTIEMLPVEAMEQRQQRQQRQRRT